METKNINENIVLRGVGTLNKGSIVQIDYETAIKFLLPKHYSGRKPVISKAFGWYDSSEHTNEHLKAVCSFGKPASHWLCIGVCGKKHSADVYELNRLCRVEDWKEPLSYFVSYCLRQLKKYNWIVVSYSDTGMNHHGYIYQACNFLYTGCTKERTDIWTPKGMHPRHYQDFKDDENQTKYRKVRTAKHRYVYFCTHDRKKLKEWQNDLTFPILPYPKGNNSNYILGEYMKDIIIEV